MLGALCLFCTYHVFFLFFVHVFFKTCFSKPFEVEIEVRWLWIVRYLLSLETMMTIGYGVPDPYMNGCWQGPFVPLLERCAECCPAKSRMIILTHPWGRRCLDNCCSLGLDGEIEICGNDNAPYTSGHHSKPLNLHHIINHNKSIKTPILSIAIAPTGWLRVVRFGFRLLGMGRVTYWPQIWRIHHSRFSPRVEIASSCNTVFTRLLRC